MQKSLSILMLMGLLFTAPGCATIVTGKYQEVPITSNPAGVKVQVDGKAQLEAPGEFKLVRNKTHTLVATYPGAEPQKRTLKHGMQGMFLGNILIGGGIGMIIDVVSGASDELTPKSVHFDFTPKGQELERKRVAYIKEFKAKHPKKYKSRVFAIQHGLVLKGMTKDDVTASVGSPVRVETKKHSEIWYYGNPEAFKYTFKKDKVESVRKLTKKK